MRPITWMPDHAWGPVDTRSWRGRLSTVLLRTGRRLIRWAWHLAPTQRRAAESVELEFCPLAEGAGGAIYRNGQLVGTLAGVQRL